MEGTSENEAIILKLAQEKSMGITDKDIQTILPNLDPEEKKAIINKFLKNKTFNLFQQSGGKTLLRLSNTRSLANSAEIGGEERIVLDVIGAEGNMGIWIRDIRIKAKITAIALDRALRTLIKKELIKLVKSVKFGKKKVYMLYNIEPDKSLLGGAWYSDEGFDAEFVEVLTQQCYRFLDEKRTASLKCLGGPIHQRNLSYATSQDCCKFITDLKISKIILAVEEVEMILEALIYDAKVEKILNANGSKSYRAVNPLVGIPSLMKTPCGVCPIRKSCGDLGDVTPIKCVYMTEWLN